MVTKVRPFRFTELANWLLENNIQLRNELQSSHYTKSYKLHSKTSFIAARLDRVIDEGIIEIIGNVEAEKNKVPVPLYRFTQSGLIRYHQFQSRAHLINNGTPEKFYHMLLVHAWF
jgi:hypothetical protein